MQIVKNTTILFDPPLDNTHASQTKTAAYAEA